MGYFRRRIDRGRSRRAARPHDSVAGVPEPEWTRILARPPRKRCFLRFSTLERSTISQRRIGVFSACYGLRRREDLGEAARRELDEILEWFGEHLPVPDFDVDRAIFFFKSDAGECTRRIWDLVRLLRGHGFEVQMQIVERPGRIVHEDEFQVAAVPWTVSGDL